ncbi:unnamed protein product [Rhodiola kirilowii]
MPRQKGLHLDFHGGLLSSKQLLHLLKSEKNPNSALSLFDSATHHPGFTHSPSTFHHILRRLVHPDLVVHVPRITDLIRAQKCLCTEDVALTVIKTYTKFAMTDRALDAFNRMPQVFGCVAGVRSYNSLLNAFAEAKQWDKAEAFFAYFQTVGIEPNLETYNVLIKISCSKKQFGKARELLDCMWKSKISPNVISYGTVINGMAKHGDLADALQLFVVMSERGVTPDVMCYNILIDGYFKQGDFLKATDIWDRLVKGSSVFPNVPTYNVMINGFCKCGMFDKSLEFWERMKRNGRPKDLYTCSTLIHGLCGSGNVDGAESVYQSVIDSGVLPDAVICNTMLGGFFSRKKLKECAELWESMGKWNSRTVSSYNIMIRGLLELQNVDEAVCVWESMPNNGFIADSKIYGVLVHGLCKNGYLNKALRILQEAEKLKVIVDTYAYSPLINTLCKAKRLTEAITLIGLMVKRGITVNSHVCNALIYGFAQTSKLDDAISLFRKMNTDDCIPTIQTYNNLLNGLCKAGRFSESYTIVKEMLEKGWKLDKVTFSILISGLCQSENLSMALRLWSQLLELNVKPDLPLYNMMIHGLCSAGRVEDGLQLFSTMKKLNFVPDLVTHNTLMDGLYKVGRLDEASDIWNLISEDGLQPDVISYNITLKGLCSCNRLHDAMECLTDAVNRGIMPTIEGAPFEDDKSLVTGMSSLIGQVRYQMAEDIELLDSFGNAYRFSVSWSRILPRGSFGAVNSRGIELYNRIIDNLLRRGIVPFLTISRYDFPQELEDRFGSWLSPLMQQMLMIGLLKFEDKYLKLVDVCFENFGDKVKHWITFNEPNMLIKQGYMTGTYSHDQCSSPFGNCSSGNSFVEPLVAMRSMLLAHGKATMLYRKKYKKEQGGLLGITGNFNMVMDPLIFGDYPKEMRLFHRNNLPKFTQRETLFLKGSLDFIGINHYTTSYVMDRSHLSAACSYIDANGFLKKITAQDGVPII